MNLLDEQNMAGQTLVRLVARGQAIIAELLRLSTHVPPVFKMEDKATQKKYQDILLDFSYVGKADYYETKIEKDPVLSDLDLDFKENYLEILKRFYVLFESIFKYITDFARYVDEVDQGVTFIQATIEGILSDETGKQLMAEALYLYGVMLLLMDQRIDGMVRERMLVCTLRYIGQNELPNIDEVCKLCARTGLDRSGRRTAGYPENFFARYSIPSRVIDMIIGRLRSDDIYSQIQAYPLPEQRSTALATQAAMLYVVLFFAPNTLQNEPAIMREIVDKHFPDNWVIAWYLGFTVDLTVEWEPYRSAKIALNNTTTSDNVNAFKMRHLKQMQPILEALGNYLTEGVLVEEFILERRNKLMATLRECNVTLRWLVLHTRRTANRKLRDQVNEGVNQQLLLQLLTLTAQFEFIFKQQLKNLLESKAQKWDEIKKESSDRMRELGDYFSGEKPLTRVKKHERLQKWFSTEIAAAIDALDVANQTVSGHKIQQLIHALEEVEQRAYNEIETNLQVKQFLVDTRAALRKMLRIVNIGEEVMATFDIVSDVSYMWDIVNEYLPAMQESIKRDPGSVLKLRSVFLKLSSILQIPCVRIGQANSPDLVSVSQYYSGELIKFVRKVLEVVPKSVFMILKEIIDIQTTQLKELPTRLDKDAIKEMAQLPLRYKLSEATFKVSVFTRGVLAMETTFVGLKQINPKQLLEDGIRKELVEQIAVSLHNLIVFQKHTIEEFEAVLNRLAGTLDGFKRSFVSIQDYINIYGLKIWQEEFQRIVHFNVEQECNVFLKRKVHDWASSYQSEAIPIPKFAPTDQSVNFIGRLGRELLHHTNPTRTTFLDKLSAWYDPSSGRESVSLKTFALLLRSVNVWGLVGLDKLISFMIVTDLKVMINIVAKTVKEGQLGNIIASFTKKIAPLSHTPPGIARLYPDAIKAVSRLIQQLPELMARIGQKQLLRRQIANILNISCKLDSNVLYHCLQNMNEAVLKDVRAFYQNPEQHPYPDNDYNSMSFELTKYLTLSGQHDPTSQLYISAKPLEDLDFILFLMIVQRLPTLAWNNQLASVTARDLKKGLDATPFTVGVMTVFQQFHVAQTDRFFAYAGQYIRAHMDTGSKDEKPTDVPQDVFTLMYLLDDFARWGHYDRNQLNEHVPPFILDRKQ